MTIVGDNWIAIKPNEGKGKGIINPLRVVLVHRHVVGP